MMDRLVERIMRKAEENKGVKGRVMAPPGGGCVINKCFRWEIMEKRAGSLMMGGRA